MKTTSYAVVAVRAPIARSRDGLVPPTECPCRYVKALAYSWSSSSWSQTAAEKLDAVVGCGVHPLRVYSSAYGADPTTTSGISARAASVPLDDLLDVVLRLEAGDDQVVAVGGQPELGQPVGSDVAENRRAVGDQLGVGATNFVR